MKLPKINWCCKRLGQEVVNGYDGLYNDSIDADWCGCKLDDLAPCSETDILNCRAGYLNGKLSESWSIGPEKIERGDKIWGTGKQS